MSLFKTLIAITSVASLPMTAFASGDHAEVGTLFLQDAVFTYEMFEAAVPHADLESCPGDFAQREVFCRLTMAGGMLHVFVFSLEGDQPLLAIESRDPGLPESVH